MSYQYIRGEFDYAIVVFNLILFDVNNSIGYVFDSVKGFYHDW